jgi:hypothetical protein
MDKRGRHPFATNAEILERALGLGTPITIGGNVDLAHRVGFAPEAHDAISFDCDLRDHIWVP